mmetsp:Transcript_10153/g.16029  ORF Transcript_10153/g.16029 Transcript_10153/m.16029 type:complete len:153 (-) Transcript_10153:74-532(-)
MPSSLTKGGRGPRNDKHGDQYDHNAFDRNLQEEIYQMTYASHALELKKKEDLRKEIDDFRQAKSQAALEDQADLKKSKVPAVTLAKQSNRKETKAAELIVAQVVKVATKKKKRKRGEKKKKKSKKQKKEEKANPLASLLGYDSDDEDEKQTS